MGGVFLTQIDGSTTYKLPPEISFSSDNQFDPAKKIVTVNINALTITDPLGSSVVGGSSPVQVKTNLDSINQLPYAEGKANTRWIWIGVNTSDVQAGVMWRNYFNYTAKVAGIPESSYQTFITKNESYIIITSPSSDYGVNVIASTAPYTARIYGVGG